MSKSDSNIKREFEQYKKVFDPINWPMDQSQIPKSLRLIFGIISFVIAAGSLVIGILFIKTDLMPALFLIVLACTATVSGLYQIKLSRK